MSLFDKYSDISRNQKIKLFYELMRPKETDTILDLGGEIASCSLTKNPTLLIDNYTHKKNLSVVNISDDTIKAIRNVYPEVNSSLGDACNLPWPDNHFDIVYSNAVIEHVGDYERQKQMASEIMRVGKKWFVTTPNRWFPFEFHMRLPFVTWLPFHGYLKVAKIICYNSVKQKYVSGLNITDLRLMTAWELKRCFPGSQIIKLRITLYPETLIVVGNKSQNKG